MTSCSRRPGRAFVGSALLMAAMVASGCASAVSGSGRVASANSTTGSSADFPSQPPSTEAPPSTTVAPPPSTSAASTTHAPPPAAATDITDLHYKLPRGFVKGLGYHPVRPLESHFLAAYAVPRDERTGLDVLSIVLYRLPTTRAIGTVAQQKLRVLRYNHKVRATRLRNIQIQHIGGHVAVEESLAEPPNFRYISWIVFSSRHVLQVTCQVDREVDKVAKACGAWIASITLG